jgi:hypothetical protein
MTLRKNWPSWNVRERGSLSETEFAQAKARLLQPPVAPVQGDALNGLRRSATTDFGGVRGLATFSGDAWLWRCYLC